MRHSKYLPGRLLRQSYLTGLDFTPILAAGTTQTVALTDSADPVITGGDAFSYTAQYTNTGIAAAIGVSVQVTLDASLAYVSATGTGWTVSRSGQVVTCTQSSVGVGAASPITINVTTGTSALTATSSVSATAVNVTGTATASQTTTVQLVSKDATSAKYVPASSTEWTNFLARKGLTNWSVPDSLYGLQEASGNPVDTLAAVNLTASGAGLVYQEAVTGWTRKGIRTHNNTAESVSGTMPVNVNASSILNLLVAEIVAAPTASREVTLFGNSPSIGTSLATNPVFFTNAGGTNIATGGSNPIGTRCIVDRYNRATLGRDRLTDQEKSVGTTGNAQAGTGYILGGFSTGASAAADVRYAYSVCWRGAKAERSDADVKALLQALGYTISWS